MKRFFKTIIIITFSTFLASESFAFFGGLSKLSKIKGLVSAGKVGSIGGARGLDELINAGAFKIKKIDKNLFDEIGKTEHQKIYKAANNSDESLLIEYNNYDMPPPVTEAKLNWYYPFNAARVEYRLQQSSISNPQPTVYVCQSNKNKVYYFTLLPKRNIAIVSSSSSLVGKEKLIIHKSSANGTYLTTYDDKNHFVLLPDYTALIYESSFPFSMSQLKDYRVNSNTTQLINKAINAECYNSNSEGDLQRITYDGDISEFKKIIDKSIKEEQLNQEERKQIAINFEKERARLKLNQERISNSAWMNIFPYLCMFNFFCILVFYFYDKYEEKYNHKVRNKKKDKRRDIMWSAKPYIRAFSSVIFGLLVYIAVIALFSFQWKSWYEVFLIIIILWYFYATYLDIKPIIKHWRDFTSSDDTVVRKVAYFSIGIPAIYFVLMSIFILKNF